jgi:hypothetical protein
MVWNSYLEKTSQADLWMDFLHLSRPEQNSPVFEGPGANGDWYLGYDKLHI